MRVLSYAYISIILSVKRKPCYHCQGEPPNAAKSIMERLCTLNKAAKHDNPVDADASGAKASTKHLELCLEVIQGHAFWDH